MVTELPPENALVTTGDGTLSPAVAAMQQLKFRIPGDTIARATAELPDDERAALRWLGSYLRSRNLGPDGADKVLRKGKGEECYSWASISALLTGKRREDGASIANMVRAIEELRRTVEGESRVGSAGYVENRMGNAMFARFDQARKRKRIAYIIGDSQLGKSENAREYTRTHNHGETFLLDMPSTGTRSALIQAFSERLSIGQAHRVGDVEQRIAECFDPRQLIIMDNVHRALRTGRGLHALTFLQWLYDARGCGMAFLMTEEGLGNLLNGRFKKQLEQLWRRRIPPLRLPSRTPDDDLALFAARYGLEPAPEELVKIRVEYIDEKGKRKERDYEKVPLELQTEVVTKEGLGVWLETLEEAKSQAKTRGRDLSWKAVLKAYCVMQADGEVLL
jgi:DNA transposition AAA+ family ATPase